MRYYNPIRIACRFWKYRKEVGQCQGCVYGYNVKLWSKAKWYDVFTFWRRWWCDKYRSYSISQAFYCAWSEDGRWGVERKLTSYRYVD